MITLKRLMPRAWMTVGLVVASIVTASVLTAVASENFSKPTSEDLRKDIAAVNIQIADAETRALKFGEGSLIRAQTELEISVLRTTRAMLEQKQSSWLRSIDLKYTVNSKDRETNSPVDLAAINDQITKTEADIEAAQQKIAAYGGLVQSMALVEHQTSATTLSMLKQQKIMIIYGLGLPAVKIDSKKPAGKSVDDKGAL